VRRRDPRQLLARRRRALASVEVIDLPESHYAPDGSVTSRQTAAVTLPRAELERIWTPEYLERLARTYWRFLTRISLGLLRVLYAETSREIVVVTRPLVLLRFREPEYEIEPDRGAVTWRIEGGLLVAPRGRGKGYLRIAVRRPGAGDDRLAQTTLAVTSEVVSFYPAIAGRFGRAFYSATQLQLHVLITNAFLRSLARLDLAPSVVGALRPREEAPAPPPSPSVRR
jgi:hypothetical protein